MWKLINMAHANTTTVPVNYTVQIGWQLSTAMAPVFGCRMENDPLVCVQCGLKLVTKRAVLPRKRIPFKSKNAGHRKIAATVLYVVLK